MSNKSLAVIGFLLLLGVLIWGIESIKAEVRRTSPGMPTHVTTSTTQPAQLGQITAYLYAVYNELNQANAIARELALKQRPDLEMELWYRAFENNVALRKSAAGYFKFRPLSVEFKKRFPTLRDRFLQENPGDAFAID